MALDIVEEAREACRARRMADQAHMQAYRHHLRLRCAFRVEHVEGVLMPREIIGRRPKEAGAELAIIVDERIGTDPMRLAVDALPIGQFVVMRVGIIEKAALLYHEPARVHARPIAAIPAERSLPDRRLERGDRPGEVLALVLLAQFLMLDPAPA